MERKEKEESFLNTDGLKIRYKQIISNYFKNKK